MSRIDCLLLDVLARDDFFVRFFIREDLFFFIGYSLFRRQRVHLFLHPMGSLVAIKTKAPLENKKMYGCSRGLPHWPAPRVHPHHQGRPSPRYLLITPCWFS